MGRFQLPLQGIDKKGGDSVGDVVLTQSFPVIWSDTGVAKAGIKLPKPYRIHSISIDTTTAFDAATATLALGILGSTARFAAALNVKAAGRVLASSDATKLANMVDLTEGDVFDIVATLTAASGAAGAAEVTVQYSCPRVRVE